MLVVMHSHSTPAQIERVLETIQQMGLTPHPMPGATRTAIGITGNVGAVDPRTIEVLPGVHELLRVTKPYKLASREMHEHDTVIRMRQGTFGERRFTIIAGPCSVEDETTILRTAEWLMGHGIGFLRLGPSRPARLTVLMRFQGRRPRGSGDPAAGARKDRHCYCDRADGHRKRRRGRSGGRRDPDRHAQHAKLQSAAASGPGAPANPVEKRHVGDPGRVVDVRRVFAFGRE